ncbi:MAG: hypothetical protein KGD67_10475 [Candidatus Lokiarchaeota archaeon]|nr:hypothetical protein [Candidatus Lokiarchaeota archaeon]
MIELITYLAKYLEEVLKISPPAAKGLLKLAIKEEFGPFKSFDNISLIDMKQVLEGALKMRLLNLEVQNYQEILEKLLLKLKKNQSLLTMGGV